MFRRWTNARTYSTLTNTFRKMIILALIATVLGFVLTRAMPGSYIWFWCFVLARWAGVGALLIAVAHLSLRAVARYAYKIS